MFDTNAFADAILAKFQTALAEQAAKNEKMLSAVTERVARIESIRPEKGADGVSFKGAMIDSEGSLVITDSNGDNQKLGVVVGGKGDQGDTPDVSGQIDEIKSLFTALSEEIKEDAKSTTKAVVEDLYLKIEEKAALIKDGEKGEPGEVGPKGDIGPKGDVGETGLTGEKGGMGPKGDVGPRGKVGEKGDIGPKGDAGPTGKKGDDGEVGLRGEKGDTGEKGDRGDTGLTGEKGDIGVPGLGVEDMSIELVGGREVKCTFERDGFKKTSSFEIPTMIYRQVWSKSEKYSEGDCVTRSGSIWHCNKSETADAPGAGSDWTLAAKCGRDGKDGSEGKRGMQGPRGRGYGEQ